MKLYGLIGYPLSHSFSKEYFQEKFKSENITDAKFEQFEINNIDSLHNLIAENPDLTGLSITIPYKQLIINHLDELEDTANKIGAVNCVKIIKTQKKTHLIGYNTDVYGFEFSLKPLLQSHHKKALILGTGGAAMAVAFVLDKLNIDHIFISRNPKGDKQISYQSINKEILDEQLLIINTTPLGMYPDINNYPDIPYQYLSDKHVLFDLIYNPNETLFLKKGKQKGATIKNGLEMLNLQADKAWEIWRKP